MACFGYYDSRYDIFNVLRAISAHFPFQSLAGAGGGGFMVLLTKQAFMAGFVRDVIRSVGLDGLASCHAVSIDSEGISVVIGEGDKQCKVEIAH
jgi:hypothetical protein